VVTCGGGGEEGTNRLAGGGGGGGARLSGGDGPPMTGAKKRQSGQRIQGRIELIWGGGGGFIVGNALGVLLIWIPFGGSMARNITSHIGGVKRVVGSKLLGRKGGFFSVKEDGGGGYQYDLAKRGQLPEGSLDQGV